MDKKEGGIGPPLKGPAQIRVNTDGEIFHGIADGVAGTAMKGFKNELSEECAGISSTI